MALSAPAALSRDHDIWNQFLYAFVDDAETKKDVRLASDNNLPCKTRCHEFSTSHAKYLETKNPTIYALSTAPGRAAIAVIRISGSSCVKIYEALCPDSKLPKPRYAVVRGLYDSSKTVNTGSLLDSGAIILYFPSPRSATGEDILELHVHGGPAVVKAVLSAIGKCNSPASTIRYAEPGEFTRRAFTNGRLDLTQVEALGDTLSAITEEQRRLSVQGTVSGLAERYESWRQQLLQARGELEALIDFSEDQHFDESPASLTKSVAVHVQELAQRLSFHSSNAMRGELLRNGIGISLIGSPNAGKSSLLNHIVGRNAAIVSKEAGTTRDIVEVGLDLGGFFCRMGDTAGLRKHSGVDPGKVIKDMVSEVEQEGIKRAKAKAFDSDVVILVLSIEPSTHDQGVLLSLSNEVIATANALLEKNKTIIIAVNKMDLYGQESMQMVDYVRRSIEAVMPKIKNECIFYISCRNAENALGGDSDPGHLQTLLTGLIQAFKAITSPLTPKDAESNTSIWQESLGATERQRILLETCRSHLLEFLKLVSDANRVANEDEIDIVLAAESLRAAADCLARITGRGEANDVEEVLGVVFEKFCVGKVKSA